MKILWICNTIPSFVATKLDLQKYVTGGWIDGALSKLLQSDERYSFSFCFPYTQIIDKKDEKFSFYSFKEINVLRYDDSQKQRFIRIFEDIQPDIIHIYGTEFPHTLAAVNAAETIGILNKVVISIQGLISICELHYYCGLPSKIIHQYTFRDLVKKDCIARQKEKFSKRGEFERKALAKVLHIIGRTNWDHACTRMISPKALYHYCGETLRDEFYKNANAWSFNRCIKHSLFVSQASYPLKGFHNVIEAVHILKTKYRDISVYTTGVNPFLIPKYRIGAYQKYLCNLIDRYGLRKEIVFLGALSADKMCDRYLLSNVFVSASSIENSPNSVGEAMLLGMPIVASYVGGTMDMLTDKLEGYLYQSDAPYMLAHYVDVVFEEEEMAKNMGINAYRHALMTHDSERNMNDLLKVYNSMIN